MATSNAPRKLTRRSLMTGAASIRPCTFTPQEARWPGRCEDLVALRRSTRSRCGCEGRRLVLPGLATRCGKITPNQPQRIEESLPIDGADASGGIATQCGGDRLDLGQYGVSCLCNLDK